MAMIKCPECGRMVSNMAASCPTCGYPIASAVSDGVVRIKLGMFQSTQGATISANGRTLWNGKTGQIVELKLSQATKVQIKYHIGMYDGAGSCEGIIDPRKSKKWQVVSRPGFITMKLTLQPVDYFDAN